MDPVALPPKTNMKYNTADVASIVGSMQVRKCAELWPTWLCGAQPVVTDALLVLGPATPLFLAGNHFGEHRISFGRLVGALEMPAVCLPRAAGKYCHFRGKEA